jgi:hypothetical protein
MGVLGIVGNAGVDNGIFGRYEPKRSWAWKIEFYPMAQGSAIAQLLNEDVKKSLSTAVISADRPSTESTPIELAHGNEIWFVPGKVNWSGTATIRFNDPIPQELGGRAGDKDIAFSTSSIFWSWMNLVQNSSNAQGSISFDVKSNIILIQYHPSGASEVERWIYYGAFPTSISRGSVDYTTNDAITAEVTFQFDKFLRIALGTNIPPASVVDINSVR